MRHTLSLLLAVFLIFPPTMSLPAYSMEEASDGNIDQSVTKRTINLQRAITEFKENPVTISPIITALKDFADVLQKEERVIDGMSHVFHQLSPDDETFIKSQFKSWTQLQLEALWSTAEGNEALQEVMRLAASHVKGKIDGKKDEIAPLHPMITQVSVINTTDQANEMLLKAIKLTHIYHVCLRSSIETPLSDDNIFTIVKNNPTLRSLTLAQGMSNEVRLKVATLCPYLESLVLSSDFPLTDGMVSAFTATPRPNIKSLTLHKDIPFATIMALAKACTNLQELHLTYAHLKDIKEIEAIIDANPTLIRLRIPQTMLFVLWTISEKYRGKVFM